LTFDCLAESVAGCWWSVCRLAAGWLLVAVVVGVLVVWWVLNRQLGQKRSCVCGSNVNVGANNQPATSNQHPLTRTTPLVAQSATHARMHQASQEATSNQTQTQTHTLTLPHQLPNYTFVRKAVCPGKDHACRSRAHSTMVRLKPVQQSAMEGIANQLLCSLCRKTLEDPRTTDCKHHFCL
jgi:hypothetical protein